MGSICHGYMCILLYKKLIGAVVLHRSMANWRRGGVSLPWVNMHSTICETSLV